MQRQPSAFTTEYSRITRVLFNNVHIAQAFNRSSFPTPPRPEDIGAKKFISIWDTGATGTVISQKVIDECGLKPISLARVTTASQRDVLTTVYFVSIILPMKIVIPQLRVVKGSIAGDADVLIGMDIISNGDFSVTNYEGKTVFSFRMPSIERIDFVEKARKVKPLPPRALRKVGRNDPCPCGSGKKYKNCCGK